MYLFRVDSLIISYTFTYSKAFTQQAHSDTSKANPSKNVHSIQFAITSDFKISSFDNSSFSGKYDLNNNKSIRLTLSLRGNYYEIDYNDMSETSRDNYSSQFELDLIYIKYFKRENLINFYYGFGPKLTYSKDGNINRRSRTPSYGIESEQDYYSSNAETISYGYGMKLNWGCEIYIYQDISIFAEYGYNALYIQGNSEGNNISDRTHWQISFNPEVVNLGVSLYF